ncbi:uncharacterized protein LOC134719389 isoform X2 [Mytilus trossulus]|uniref:uncharacterized protein LOC134719389 isoform X2 n=1 Tax=Mytilus trossulus TaxID=6551 RepID=UPI003007CF02
MEVIPTLYGNCKFDNLPLIVATAFTLVMDVILLSKLLLKRDGSHITDGDIVAIVVMMTFTAGVLILDAYFIFAKGQHSRKLKAKREYTINREEAVFVQICDKSICKYTKSTEPRALVSTCTNTKKWIDWKLILPRNKQNTGPISKV